MPTPNERQGLPELQEVLQRIGRDTLGLPLTDDHYRQVANRFYDRTFPPDIQDPLPDDHPALDPKWWFTRGEDGEPDGVALAHHPEFALRMPPGEIRDRSLSGYSGAGWSRADRDRLGREPHAMELSPGDYLAKQRERDIRFLDDMLNRQPDLTKQAPGFEWNTSPSGHDWDPTGLVPSSSGTVFRLPAFREWLTGTPNTKVERDRRTRDALHWFNKGEGARYSVGEEPRPSFGSITDTLTSRNRTANYPQHGGYAGTIDAMSNPDYSFGHINNWYLSPLEYTHNRVAMRNALLKDTPEQVERMREPGIGYPVASARHFFQNALKWDGDQHPLQDAMDVAKLGRIQAHSPRVPLDEYEPSPEARSQAINDARQTLKQTDNMTASDHYRAKTGHQMSFLGQLGSSLLSSSQDISTAAAGALPAKSLLARAGRIGSEAIDDAPMAVASSAMQFLLPRQKGLEVPEYGKLWTEDHRPDLQFERDDEFTGRMRAFDHNQDSA